MGLGRSLITHFKDYKHVECGQNLCSHKIIAVWGERQVIGIAVAIPQRELLKVHKT